jgi:hypothetical protein
LSNHKFKVGQDRALCIRTHGRGASSGVYKVTQALPSEGDDRQYRIKSAAEPHERVVKESHPTASDGRPPRQRPIAASRRA